MLASEVPLKPHDKCGCNDCCRWFRSQNAPSPDWRVDPETGRKICTLGRPRPDGDRSSFWSHPHAIVDQGANSDYSESYVCPACGLGWDEELPE
jgi:hypothetical protein